MLLDPAAGYLLDLGGALLFAAAAAHKLGDLPAFTEAFVAFRVLPDAWARRAARLVPCVELATALALALTPASASAATRRAAALAASGLLLAYASAIALNLVRGRRELDCGCGRRRDRRPIASWMVWRNVMIAAALGAAALPWTARPLGPADVLTVAGGLTVAALLYAAVDRLCGEIAPRALAMRGMP